MKDTLKEAAIFFIALFVLIVSLMLDLALDICEFITVVISRHVPVLVKKVEEL